MLGTTSPWQFTSFNAEWSWDSVCDEYRDISYGKDYDEIVLKSLEGLDGTVYCRDFDYDKYNIFEKRLDQRFEDYRRNSVDLMDNMEE